MALWDTADCLQRCKDDSRRANIAADAAVTDAMWYRWLTEAQEKAYADIFSSFPDYAYSAPQLLTSADGGFTYTFGNDADGDPIRPFGHAEIYPSLSAIPDSPLEPGIDFIFEGGLIRFPGSRSRLFPNGPYARFAADPSTPIDLTHPPQLQPKFARVLLVDQALERWAARPGSGVKPDYYIQRYGRNLQAIYKRLATSYNMQGSQQAGAEGRVWWYSQDLGAIGLNV